METYINNNQIIITAILSLAVVITFFFVFCIILMKKNRLIDNLIDFNNRLSYKLSKIREDHPEILIINNGSAQQEQKKEYFPVTSVARADLEGLGYDTTAITDDQMEELASKLGDDYCEQLFWISLNIIAELMGFALKPDYQVDWDEQKEKPITVRAHSLDEAEALYNENQGVGKTSELDDEWDIHAKRVLDEVFPKVDSTIKNVFIEENWSNALTDRNNCDEFEEFLKDNDE